MVKFDETEIIRYDVDKAQSKSHRNKSFKPTFNLIDKYKIIVYEKVGYPEINTKNTKTQSERINDQASLMNMITKGENDENDPNYIYKSDIKSVKDYLYRKDILVLNTFKQINPSCLKNKFSKRSNRKNL